jgi:hypothetical protein
MDQISSQLRVIAGAISLDLFDDELGVSFHEELLNPQRQGCTQPKEQCFVLHHVVGWFEVQVHHILELVPMRREKQYPYTDPLLTQGAVKEESSVDLVKTGALGSGSLLFGPPGGLADGVQSTMKLVSTWLLTAWRGTKFSSNSANSAAHLVILSVALGLWSTPLKPLPRTPATLLVP